MPTASIIMPIAVLRHSRPTRITMINGDDEVGGNAQNEAVGEPLQRFVASNCGGVGVLTGGDDLGHTTAGEHHNQGGDERL